MVDSTGYYITIGVIGMIAIFFMILFFIWRGKYNKCARQVFTPSCPNTSQAPPPGQSQIY